jgi:hypothetical protein
VVRGSQEVSKPALSYPACVGVSLRSRWLCTLWVPSLDSSLYRHVGRALIVCFTIMNGTAWRRSHSDFHLPPYSINLTPHYTSFFFFMHCSFNRDKERQGHRQIRQILVEMVGSRHEVIGEMLADSSGKLLLKTKCHGSCL